MKYLYYLIMAFLIISCTKLPENELIIAISKASGNPSAEKYKIWAEKIFPEAKIYDLYTLSKDSVSIILSKCDGLILSGGPDVFPGRYGCVADTALCTIDYRRDTLEFSAIKVALKRKLPILAICRGEQIFNVALNGSLFVDIPRDINSHLHQDTTNPDKMHHIYIFQGSYLNKITNLSEGNVNSNHHQAVKLPAEEIKITAVAEDGIVEAYEWRNPQNKPFLIAVQWHPERLGDANPLSKKIGEAFRKESIKYNNK